MSYATVKQSYLNLLGLGSWIPDSFGYEAEHVDASLHMAELSLFPRIRNSDVNTLLIADGTSCRHQIHDGLGRKAMHTVRVLEMALP